MRTLFRTLRFILQHPLNKGRRWSALGRYLRWQIGSRLVFGPVAVPFVERTRLLVFPGMTGATGNVYCGLHEYADMAFLLHVLRPGDLFVDVGANIGSYSVLAAGVCSARVIAFEPAALAYARFLDNVRLNDISSIVDARCVALGKDRGSLPFSSDLDTTNHFLTPEERATAQSVAVPVDTMDGALQGQVPLLVKIDVEGFETAVVEGGASTISSPALLAVLMELNGSGARYGFDENRLHTRMQELGFSPYSYDPRQRLLVSADKLERPKRESGNILYARDIVSLRARIMEAPLRSVHGTTI